MSIENKNSMISIDTILGDTILGDSILDDSKCVNSELASSDVNDANLPILIYRFKFTEEFMTELYNFSKIHQYDDRKDFKDAWNVWIIENEYIVNDEMRRLTNLGYEGDILNKMFKSARYYFRKKSSEKKKPIQRRQYISVNKELLDAMDNHIENKIYELDYQPKTGFIGFCKDNEKVLKETIMLIFEQGIKDSHVIEDKIKKTYKNRHFMIINKNKQVKTT
jgi:hypothetical protein